jgi:hypothetical protein
LMPLSLPFYLNLVLEIICSFFSTKQNFLSTNNCVLLFVKMHTVAY